MFQASATSNLDDLDRYVSQVDASLGSLGALASGLAQAIGDGVRENILAGRDGSGGAVAPLAKSTLRHRTGGGPPCAPHGAASRMVSQFHVTTTTSDGRIRVLGDWDVPFARFLIGGTRHMPARDFAGIAPTTLSQCSDLVDRHITKALS